MKTQMIAMVEKWCKLTEAVGYGSAPEIQLAICRLGEDGKPRNYRREYDEKGANAGGCFARIWASSATYHLPGDLRGNVFSACGPEISYGKAEDYKDAHDGMKMVAKRQAEQYATRGNAADAADEMGRWLEACGVSRVFYRDIGKSEEWLNRGEWTEREVGPFIIRLREHLFVTPGLAPLAA